MRKISLALLLVFAVIIVEAQSDKEPFLTKSLSGQSIQKVSAETSGGSIALSGNDANPRIEVYIRGNNNKNYSNDEIQQIINENYTLSIETKTNELVAIAKQKNKITNWKKSLNISFKIFTSKKIDSKLSTSGGSIAISNVSGKQDFGTSGGSLKVNNVNGYINGRTSGGSIDLQDAEGEIDLSTSGGSIRSLNVNGSIKLHTSGGSVSFQMMKGKINIGTSGGSLKGSNIKGELAAHTSGGSINLQELSCSLQTSTSGGNIDVQLKELGEYVTIDNSGGSISLHIPAGKGADLNFSGNKISTPQLNNFSGKTDKNSLVGKVNGGGIPISVSGSGNINLYMD